MSSTQATPSSDPTPSLQCNPAPSLFSLAKKRVLLTGATRGIGVSVAWLLQSNSREQASIQWLTLPPLSSSISIQAACALAAAQAGATCCLVVRPGQLKKTAQGTSHPALEALPTTSPDQRHCCVEAYLADMSQVKSIVDKALQLEEMEGKIDVVVNCGGIQRRNPSTEFTEEDWDEVSCD